MKEYMTKTREDYGLGIARPKFGKDAKFELKVKSKEYGDDVKEVSKELEKLQVNSTESGTSLGRLLKEKWIIEQEIKVNINEHCSTIVKDDLPPMETDPGSLEKLAPSKLIIELTDKTVKRPKGIAENVLAGIDNFFLLVDFIVLDMPEDTKILLILGRPFLSTAQAKIDVFKRKFALRVRNGIIVFKCDSPTSNIIKKDLEYGDFIELNDLNEPLKLRRKHRIENLDPILEDGEVIDEPMKVIENIDAYRDKDMGDIIVGKPFYKNVFVKVSGLIDWLKLLKTRLQVRSREVLLKLILHVHRIKRWRYNLTLVESKFKTPMLDHQDKYMMKAQKIMGYGDYQIGNVTIYRVYYMEGLGHNLFSVGQFCDLDLEVAFCQHTCFIPNLDEVDLLTGSRGNNLYTLSLQDMMSSLPICLLSKASKTKSWLWHRRFVPALSPSQSALFLYSYFTPFSIIPRTSTLSTGSVPG
nr:integrase, catalytic region, zinc finger, CCHC-type, peptidase aspartic, catalytic [Tanacetum cinerariifolium]